MILVMVVIDRHAVRAVAINRRRQVGDYQIARGVDTLRAELQRALSEMPRPRFGRPRVTVTVDASSVRVKRLAGLPPVRNTLTLRRLVEQQLSRFFIGATTSAVHVAVDCRNESAFAALYDESIVRAITEACSNSNMKLLAIRPPSGIAARSGEVVREPRGCGHALGDEVGALGSGKFRAGPLAWRPQSDTGSTRAIVRAGLLAILAASCVAAVGAKGLRADFAARAAESRLLALRRFKPAIDSTESEIAKMQTMNLETTRFRLGRRYVTELLGQLATSLPESTAITSLRVDSTGAMVTLLSNDVDETVRALLEDPYFASAQLQGGVVEEVVGPAHLERAAIHLVTRYSARGRLPRR
jgi:hypothetical protein